MGAGKSAVGRQLARLLHLEFVDSDDEIMQCLQNSSHTLLPVWREDINDILGILHMRSISRVIDHQGLFTPVIDWVRTYDGKTQEALFYLANGFLSMISDNVFVATIYVGEIKKALVEGQITRETFDLDALPPSRPHRWLDLAPYVSCGSALQIQTKRGSGLRVEFRYEISPAAVEISLSFDPFFPKKANTYLEFLR